MRARLVCSLGCEDGDKGTKARWQQGMADCVAAGRWVTKPPTDRRVPRIAVGGARCPPRKRPSLLVHHAIRDQWLSGAYVRSGAAP